MTPGDVSKWPTIQCDWFTGYCGASWARRSSNSHPILTISPEDLSITATLCFREMRHDGRSRGNRVGESVLNIISQNSQLLKPILKVISDIVYSIFKVSK